MSIVEQFEAQSSETPYTPHKVFAGVYMKHLVTGAQTDGRFSSHLIKVDPNGVLDTHVHATQIEVHQVLAGSGDCTLDDKSRLYVPGSVAVIPQNVPHKIVAGPEGIYLLAQFTPALL